MFEINPVSKEAGFSFATVGIKTYLLYLCRLKKRNNDKC